MFSHAKLLVCMFRCACLYCSNSKKSAHLCESLSNLNIHHRRHRLIILSSYSPSQSFFSLSLSLQLMIAITRTIARKNKLHYTNASTSLYALCFVCSSQERTTSIRVLVSVVYSFALIFASICFAMNENLATNKNIIQIHLCCCI